jgi:drug/metabolite transporter (DMT)-like permease
MPCGGMLTPHRWVLPFAAGRDPDFIQTILKEEQILTQNSRFSYMDLVLIFTGFIWGINPPIMKVGLTHLPPGAYNMVRLAVALVLSWGLLWKYGTKKKVEKEDRKRLLILGFLGFTIFQVFFTYGVKMTTAGNASLILSLVPISVAAISWLSTGEKIGPATFLGILFSVIGVVFIVAGSGNEFSFRSNDFAGVLMVIGAQISFAFYMVYSRPLLQKYSLHQITAWIISSASLVFVALSYKEMTEINWSAVPLSAWASAAYSGIFGLCVGNILWSWGIKKIGSTRTALYNNLPPVFSIITGCLFLGEPFGMQQLLGAVLIFTGLYVSRLKFQGRGIPLRGRN